MIVFSIVLFIVAIALPSISGSFISNSSNIDLRLKKISPILFSRLATIAFLFSAFLSYNVLYVDILSGKLGLFSGLFTVSSFSLSMEIFIYSTASLVLVGWFIQSKYTENNSSGNLPILSEYSLMLMFTVLGASLLVTSADLMSMYLSIELQSFSVYILATLYKDNEQATAAGLKYFLLGGLSSCFILFGSALIYSLTGLTNLENIFNLLSSVTTSSELYPSLQEGLSLFSIATDVTSVQITAISAVIGFLFITVGFLFKIAAAPFHFWAPDVYDQVPTSVTMWLTIIPKISVIILLLELMSLSLVSVFSTNSAYVSSDLFTMVNVWIIPLKNIFIISSLLSLIIGGLVGLVQHKIKRLLAYSTISHVGFLLLALGINSESSIESLIFYLVQYSVTTLNIFLILLGIGYTMKKSYKNSLQKNSFGSVSTDINYISELKGTFSSNPLLSLSLAISLFSVAGVPPLLGFFAKQQVLYAALENGYYFMSIIAILLSVVSASYYLQIIKTMIFSKKMGLAEFSISKEENGIENSVSNVHSMTISVLTLFILLFILNPSIFLDSTQLLSSLLFTS